MTRGCVFTDYQHILARERHAVASSMFASTAVVVIVNHSTSPSFLPRNQQITVRNNNGSSTFLVFGRLPSQNQIGQICACISLIHRATFETLNKEND